MAQQLSSDGPLSEARLRAALGARPFHFEPLVDSTNNIAWHWALENAPAGAVVVAEEQTLGRGRFGRSWVAPAETGLLMSVILRPRQQNHQIEHIGRLTIVGAVALAETLAASPGLKPEQVGLKWPNDVQLEGRKVAGILAEAVWLGESLSAVVLGIGLNVRVDFSGTPLVTRATSIETVATGTSVDRAALLARLLERVDYWAARIGENDALMTAWRARLTTLGKRVEVRAQSQDEDGTVIVGQAVEVDDDGALILRDEDGAMHRVVAGDVTLAEE